jgi:hypothetical protein
VVTQGQVLDRAGKVTLLIGRHALNLVHSLQLPWVAN